MAIDFTGVTNVFMGGDIYNETPSLQCVYQGETEQWAYTDQGYVWRMMGGTYQGYDRFYDGDVVCFGYQSNTIWKNMSKTKLYDVRIAKNCYSPSSHISNPKISIIQSTKMQWSDDVGSDGVTIGWHISQDQLNYLNPPSFASYAYRVYTTGNGVWARFQTNNAYWLTTKTVDTQRRMALYPETHWWCTFSRAGSGTASNPFSYYECTIRDNNSTPNNTSGGDSDMNWLYENSVSVPAGKYTVVFKRVKINANNQ